MTKHSDGKAREVAPQVLTGPDGRIEIVDDRTLWNDFIRMSEVTARLPAVDGRQMELRHLVHDHGNAAAVLPVDYGRRTVLLIRQWRIPPVLNGYPQRLLEAIAGLIDGEESAEDCARREALEEAGYEISGLVQIGDVFSSPGTLTERCIMFLAEYGPEGKRNDGGGLANESEDIQIEEMPIADAFAMLDDGRIRDAKTMILLLNLRQKLVRRDARQAGVAV